MASQNNSVWQGTSAADDAAASPQQRIKSGGSPGARGRQQQRQSRGMASKMADANDSVRGGGDGGSADGAAVDVLGEIFTAYGRYIITNF